MRPGPRYSGKTCRAWPTLTTSLCVWHITHHTVPNTPDRTFALPAYHWAYGCVVFKSVSLVKQLVEHTETRTELRVALDNIN